MSIPIQVVEYVADSDNTDDMRALATLANKRAQAIEKAELDKIRKEASYEAALTWQPGTAVRIINTGYKTFDGRVGEIVELVLPTEGNGEVRAFVQTKARVPQRIRAVSNPQQALLTIGGSEYQWVFDPATGHSSRMLKPCKVQVEAI